MDYENHKIGLAKSRNFLKGESKDFINWAFGMNQNLLNNLKSYMTAPVQSIKETDSTSFMIAAGLGTVFVMLGSALYHKRQENSKIAADQNG